MATTSDNSSPSSPSGAPKLRFKRGPQGSRASKNARLVADQARDAAAKIAAIEDVKNEVEPEPEPEPVKEVKLHRDLTKFSFSFYTGKVEAQDAAKKWVVGSLVLAALSLAYGGWVCTGLVTLFIGGWFQWKGVAPHPVNTTQMDWWKPFLRVLTTGRVVQVEPIGEVHGEYKDDVRPFGWQQACKKPHDNAGFLRVRISYYTFFLYSRPVIAIHECVISCGFFWSIVGACQNLTMSSSTQRERIAAAAKSTVGINLSAKDADVVANSQQLAHLYLMWIKYSAKVDFPIAHSATPCDMDIGLERWKRLRLYYPAAGHNSSVTQLSSQTAVLYQRLLGLLYWGLLFLMVTHIMFPTQLHQFLSVLHANPPYRIMGYVGVSIALWTLGWKKTLRLWILVIPLMLMTGLIIRHTQLAGNSSYMTYGNNERALNQGQEMLTQMSNSLPRTNPIPVLSTFDRYMHELTTTNCGLVLSSTLWRTVSTSVLNSLSTSQSRIDRDTYLIGFRSRIPNAGMSVLTTPPSNPILIATPLKGLNISSIAIMLRSILEPSELSKFIEKSPAVVIVVDQKDVESEFLQRECLGKCAQVLAMDSLILSYTGSSFMNYAVSQQALLFSRVTMPSIGLAEIFRSSLAGLDRVAVPATVAYAQLGLSDLASPTNCEMNGLVFP